MPMTGPNLDLLCVWKLDDALFCEIMQHFILMQNTQKWDWIKGGEIFGAFFFFFQKNVIFDQYRMLP